MALRSDLAPSHPAAPCETTAQPPTRGALRKSGVAADFGLRLGQCFHGSGANTKGPYCHFARSFPVPIWDFGSRDSHAIHKNGVRKNDSTALVGANASYLEVGGQDTAILMAVRTMRAEFSAPLPRKRLAFSIQDL
jgi:hypothetical protein